MEASLFLKMSEIEAEHWWFCGRREIVKSLVRKTVKKQRMKILDAGCGTGGNLAFLSEFGEVTGLEPDEQALKIAQRKGFAVYKGGIDAADLLFKEKFDLVVLLDVLEHIMDDSEALQVLYRYLKPGGHLILTVPAHSYLWSEHDRRHCHYRRYERGEVGEKLKKAGFDVKYLSYFNTWLYPFVVLYRLIFKNKNNLWMPVSGFNRLLSIVFATERYLIGRVNLPFGVSIVASAQKN